VLLIGILFGLAMDYEVFLVSRMREAYVKSGNPREAIVTGYGQSINALHKLTAARQLPAEQEAPGHTLWFRRSQLDIGVLEAATALPLPKRFHRVRWRQIACGPDNRENPAVAGLSRYSSAWIRTRDLTIMSRARGCEPRRRAAARAHESPASPAYWNCHRRSRFTEVVPRCRRLVDAERSLGRPGSESALELATGP